MKALSASNKVAVTIAALLLLSSSSIYGVQTEQLETKRILVLYSYHEGLPWERLINESLQNTLALQSTFLIEIKVEHTDRVSYADNVYRHKLMDLFQYKYSHLEMDLVIGVGDEAVEMLLDYGEKLFPEIPMLLITAERKTLQKDFLKPNTTSLLWGVDVRANVDLIQKLLPQTRHIFIVAGTSATDRAVLKLAQASLREDTKRFAIRYLTNIRAQDLIKRAKQLPDQSALLFLAFFRDAERKSFIPREILSIISKQANAPVFGVADSYIGYGIVGGSLLSAEMQGKRCAEIALRILRGEPPEDIIPERTLNQLMFDWRQLKRWGISEEKLPAGSIVRYKEFSIWNAYRGYIIGIIAFCLFESLLIIRLLIQRSRRYRAEKNMRESEAKFTTVFQNAPVPMLLLNEDRHILEANRAAREMGVQLQPEMKKPGFGSALRCIHSLDDPRGCGFGPSCEICPVRGIVAHTFQGGQAHYRAETKLTVGDGQEQHNSYLLVSTQLVELAQDRWVLLSVEDITESRQAELKDKRHREELAHVARRATLGEVSSSLAHELNQPLTAILSSTQAAKRFLNGPAPDLKRVSTILDHIVEDDRRASGIIRSLRSLLGKGELQVKALDINQLLRAGVTIMKSYGAIGNVAMVMELAAHLPAVRGDEIQLEQVIINLVLNASEAMKGVDDGFRKLIVTTGKHNERMVKVSVRDAGRGINPEDMQRIFEPYHSTKPGGLGMGLSISRSIIEAHGGRLWAENNSDRGATLYFTVPIHGKTGVME